MGFSGKEKHHLDPFREGQTPRAPPLLSMILQPSKNEPSPHQGAEKEWVQQWSLESQCWLDVVCGNLDKRELICNGQRFQCTTRVLGWVQVTAGQAAGRGWIQVSESPDALDEIKNAIGDADKIGLLPQQQTSVAPKKCRLFLVLLHLEFFAKAKTNTR